MDNRYSLSTLIEDERLESADQSTADLLLQKTGIADGG